MAYRQDYSFGNESMQQNFNSQRRPQPQYADQNLRGFNDRSMRTQPQNFRDPNPTQKPLNGGYPPNPNGGYNTGEDIDGDGGYEAYNAHQSTASQVTRHNYSQFANRPHKALPQPRPIDARHRPGPNDFAPRSAGPYKGTNGYYAQEDSSVPVYEAERDQYGEGTLTVYNDYQAGDDYGEKDGRHEVDGYGYDARNRQVHTPIQIQHKQYHRRGQSDGYSYGTCNVPAPQDERQGYPQQRPSYEQRGVRTNNGADVHKRKVFEDPMSPGMLAWDNPFPTFPKKGGRPEASLNGAMADMSLKQGAENTGDVRPQTNGGSNVRAAAATESSRFGSDERSRSHDTHPCLTETGGAANERQWVSSAAQNIQQGGRPSMETTREDTRFYPDYSRPNYPNGRRSEEPPRQQQPRAQGYSDNDKGRSRTMPSNISDNAMRFHSQGMQGQPAIWHDSKANAQSIGPVDRRFQQERPSTASSSRPVLPGTTRSGEIQRLRTEQATFPQGNEGPSVQQKVTRPPAVHQDSIADLYDSYFDGTSPSQPNRAQQTNYDDRPTQGEDMPNFDAVPVASGHQRGMTIDDHILPHSKPSAVPPMPAEYRRDDPSTFNGNDRSRQVVYSKSQPDLKNRRPPISQQDNGFDFGLNQTTPLHTSREDPASRMPAHSGPNAYGYDRHQGVPGNSRPGPSGPYEASSALSFNGVHQQPSGGIMPQNAPSQKHPNRPLPTEFQSDREAAFHQSYGNTPASQSHFERYRSPNGQDRAPSNRPSPAVDRGPATPPSAPVMKPDALPAHPAPVRAGLMQTAPPSQAPKPAPVRNYDNNVSPLQGLSTIRPLDPAQRSNANPTISSELSAGELEKLRHIAKSNPVDQKAQMALAKGLIQSASALEAYVPQTDQKARGKLRERYIAEAYKIIKRLASAGNPDAMFYLGDCYSQGRLGMLRDPKEAFILYQGAAKAGHAQAAFRVAVCCELGLEEDGGTKRDLGKAVQWYKRAATLGDTPAMYKTGVIQLKGLLGQPIDQGDAIIWLRKAAKKADKDNPHALHELALWHETNGTNGKSGGDEAYAKQLFVQAAELGYKFSQYRLGRACEYGLMGCPIDPRLSISWYSKAAVQEEHQSELALSGWYLTGAEGVLQQSDTEAYLWARKAATAGLAKAEFAMGYFTEVGIGCPPSSEEAKRWYWRAACKSRNLSQRIFY